MIGEACLCNIGPVKALFVYLGLFNLALERSWVPMASL